jgi:hypothetical protein
MALTFAEETLRTLQDPISLHKVVFSKYAAVAASRHLFSTLRLTFYPESFNMAEVLFGGYGMARVPSICYQTSLEDVVLVQ